MSNTTSIRYIWTLVRCQKYSRLGFSFKSGKILWHANKSLFSVWNRWKYSIHKKQLMTKKKTEVGFLTLPTIMLSNTSSSSEDMTITPLMAFLMSWRLCRITRVNRLKRISSWFRTVFMDSSYLTGNLFYKVRREQFSLDDMLPRKKIRPIIFCAAQDFKVFKY